FDRFHRASERGADSPDPGEGARQAHANGGARGAGSNGTAASDSEGSERSEGESPSGAEFGGGGGSGLGLSIVQAIANAHGGQATLESWPGYGTRVRIWLPTRAAPGVLTP